MLKNRHDLSAEQIDRTSDLMDRAIPDALVTGHEVLVSGLTLPDPDDRHVLAAAIRCHANVIVTFNEKDFPADVLETFGLEAQHPDVFVENLFDLDSAAVVAAAQRQRQQLKNPTDGRRAVSRRPAQTRPHTDRQGTHSVSRCALNLRDPRADQDDTAAT